MANSCTLSRFHSGARLLLTPYAVLLAAVAFVCAAPAQTVPANPASPAGGQTAPAAPPPSRTPANLPPVSAPVDPKTYRLGPEDIIDVYVWREGELTGSHMIRPDGKITMRLIGDIQAGGLTPEEMTREVEKSLSKIINSPQVTVSVRSVQSKKFFCMGEVNRPGTIPLVMPITALQAMTECGGFREFANTKKITILRNSKPILFNYNEVSKGKKQDQNILIEAGDYIIVK